MKQKENSAPAKSKSITTDSKMQQPRSPEEAKVWDILEQARQKVKPIVKREKEAEVLTSDLLNLRLKAL